MSVSLRTDKPLASEVRRVATGYLKRAKDELTRQPDGPHEAIHQARRQFKRLRGLYRLTATADKTFQKAENERIGALGRSLRASRDATSLVETARRLADRAATAEERKALERVHKRLRARRDAEHHDQAIAGLIADAIATCDAALSAVDALDFESGPKRAAQILAHGWQSTGRKAVRALAEAHELGTPECFHALRKRTQDRWIHCKFLSRVWPTALRGTADEAKQLMSLLGENQDIALLASLTVAHPAVVGPPEDLARLRAVMIREGDRLRAEALERADDLYDADAKADAARIELLWRHAA